MSKKSIAKRSLTDADGEVREIARDDLVAFHPIADIDPGMLDVARRSRGRPTTTDPKVHIGFRLAADVVEGIRATGRGYNSRVERVLRAALTRGEI